MQEGRDPRVDGAPAAVAAEVVDVLCRFMQALDQRDALALSQCLAPAAQVDLGVPGASWTGAESVVSGLLSRLEDFALTQHFLSTSTVRGDEHSSVARCYVMAQHRPRAAAGDEMCLAGEVADAVLLRLDDDDRWRLERLRLRARWVEGVTAGCLVGAE